MTKFLCMCAEVEHLINSLFLTHVSDDHNDPLRLTPATFGPSEPDLIDNFEKKIK
jgi:hypothetical protein